MTILIGEAASRSGLSIDTIRYYETLGLTEGATRDSTGRRTFTTEGVVWLVFLRRMRETNMSIADLQEYVRCRRDGAAGIDGVLAVLGRHRDAVERQQAELAECCRVVETKIAKYQALAAARRGPGSPEV